MKKRIICFAISFSFFIFLIPPVFAETNFSISVTGAQKKGDAMSITAVITDGEFCDQNGGMIQAIGVSGVGAGYPYAVDLTAATITATINGIPIPGHLTYSTNPPMENYLILHTDPAFQYHQKTDRVSVHITGVKKGNVGGLAIGVYLIDTKNQIGAMGLTGCASGYQVYNTITSLSDSALTPGDPSGQSKVYPTIVGIGGNIKNTPTPTVVLDSPTVPIRPTLLPHLPLKTAPQEKVPNRTWYDSLIFLVKSLFQ